MLYPDSPVNPVFAPEWPCYGHCIAHRVNLVVDVQYLLKGSRLSGMAGEKGDESSSSEEIFWNDVNHCRHSKTLLSDGDNLDVGFASETSSQAEFRELLLNSSLSRVPRIV